MEPMSEDLGLEEMLSEVSSSERSEPSSTTVSEAEDTESASTSSEGSEGGGSSSGFSTDVSARGNVSAPGARRASFWTRAPPVTF